MRVKILTPALVLTAVVLLGGCTGSYSEKNGKNSIAGRNPQSEKLLKK